MPTSGLRSLFLAGTLIAVGGLLVTYFARLGAIDPSSLPGAPDARVAVDLLDAARDAWLLHDTREIAFGTKAALELYDEPDPRQHLAASGFKSMPAADGLSHAIAVGERAALRFVVLDRKPVRAILAAASLTGAAQRVEVRVNDGGSAVCTFELPPLEEATALIEGLPRCMIDLTDAPLVDGVNRLELAFSATLPRTFQDQPYRMLAAAVVSHLRFLTENEPAEPASLPRKVAELAIEPVAGVGRSLVSAQGSRTCIPFELPWGRPRFQATFLAHPDDRADRDLPVVARMRFQPSGRVLLLRQDLDASSPPAQRVGVPVDIDLSLFADSAAQLEIDTPPAPAGSPPLRLVISAPVIRGGGPRPRAPAAERRGDADELRRSLRQRNLVVITLDAAAARHFTAYGQEKEYATAVDIIGRDGVVFDDVTSPSSYTLPAVASLLTGLLPRRHGLVDNGAAEQPHRLADSTATLASRLADAGYHTLALVTNPNAGAIYGFARGYQRFDELFRPERGLWSEQGGVAADAMVDALDEHIAAGHLTPPYHLYLHVFQPHAPYLPPQRFRTGIVSPAYDGPADGSRALIEGYRQQRIEALDAQDFRALRDLYRANLACAADAVERMLRALLAAGLLEETVVAVVGDHGEAFGEHANLEHGDTVFAEEIEVPWVMMLPRGAQLDPCRVQGPCSLVDVAPTLLSLLSVHAGADLDGLDLSTRMLIDGDADPDDRPLVSRSAGFEPRYVLRYRGFAYHVDLLTRAELLFDLTADPLEREPLPTLDSPRARMMRSMLSRYVCDHAGGEAVAAALDPATQALTKQLGYATDTAGAAPHAAATCPLRQQR